MSAPVFLTSVGLGAALTVLVATRAGLPVSTTHALIGGLVGAGLAASPGEVQFARLGQSFVLPLLASPIAAAVLGLAAVRLLRLRPAAQDCVCLAAAPLPAAAGAGAVHASVALPRIIVEEAQVCARQPLASRRWSVAQALDRLHVGTATLICFARAVNDTPKLAALLLAAQVMPPRWSSVLIATVMVAGGLLFARRVAETMSKRVTRMDHTQGVAANLITSALVLAASLFALPVSTTHVAVGAIAGVGAANGLQWETLRNVLLSWIATLPLAALLAEAAFQVLGALA